MKMKLKARQKVSIILSTDVPWMCHFRCKKCVALKVWDILGNTKFIQFQYH